jgi:hypothetical protein
MSLFVFGLLAVIAGALAASNFVIEKLPNTKGYLEKIVPYQAVIGVVAMILSVLKLLDAFSIRADFFTKLINFGCIASTVVVGFLLGFPMVQQFFADDEKSKLKADEFRKKLSPYQVIAGLVAIGTGLYLILFGVVAR